MMMELEHNQAKAAASKCNQRKVWDYSRGWFSNIFATEELQEETTDCAAAPLCT